MFKTFLTLFHFELLKNIRSSFAWLTPLFFFLIIISLFSFSFGADQSLLQQITPALIWISVLLSILLSINHLFQSEIEEGYLDSFVLSPFSLTLIVLNKVLCHWLFYALPLILISPFLGFLLHLPAQENTILVITLLLGTPVLCLLGGIGAALTVGIRGNGFLIPILIMPLYIPVLVFGTGTLLNGLSGQALMGSIALLAAIFLLTLAVAPMLIALALRIGVNH